LGSASHLVENVVLCLEHGGGGLEQQRFGGEVGRGLAEKLLVDALGGGLDDRIEVGVQLDGPALQFIQSLRSSLSSS
jgi:hypothetical protein